MSRIALVVACGLAGHVIATTVCEAMCLRADRAQADEAVASEQACHRGHHAVRSESASTHLTRVVPCVHDAAEAPSVAAAPKKQSPAPSNSESTADVVRTPLSGPLTGSISPFALDAHPLLRPSHSRAGVLRI